MSEALPALARFTVVLIVMSIILGGLERRWPSVPAMRVFRPGWRLDVTYAFLSHFLVNGLRMVAILAVLAPLVMFVLPVPFGALRQGFGPLARQPAWLQGVEMIVLADLLGYWTHRAFHRGRLWRFHAIHHSSSYLDWLAAFRAHPVNEILNSVATAVPLVCLGFRPTVLAGVIPFLGLYALLIHANLGWDFGWCRWIVASPAFHRWHHTSAAEGRDRNFAGLLPVWDQLFGTLYLPPHPPVRFGVDDPVPRGLFGQLIWPFRRP